VRNLSEHLTEYAGYHRDKRNIATHFIGIPMIVVAVATLFYGLHPYVGLGAMVAAALFYLGLDVRLGLAMLVFLGGSLEAASALSMHAWLITGVALFVVGWVFQFVGHYFEGRKPAFVDDVIGLLIGPLFITAELAFMVGLRSALKADIEAKVGPTRIRPLAEPAAPR
jgi:uncharacterized membrane protein YGL010W